MAFCTRARLGLAIGVAVLSAAATASAPTRAADVVNGRKIAAVKCQMCHGLDGRAKLPEAPNLSGQAELYLAEQMKAFHDGVRKNDMMTLVAKTLSENEIADLAAYYAAIEITIGKIPGE
jgi:cytochrome c553